MGGMGKRAAFACAMLLLALAAPPAVAQNASGACGNEPITIARMQWPSAALLAHVHARVIGNAYGCEVRVVAGDLGATGSSMATTGRPMVAPEMWVGRIPEIWNAAIEAEMVRALAPSFTGGALEGWFMPAPVAEAHPEIVDAEDLAANWRVFARPGAARATFLSCPPDWACSVINRNLIRSLGLQNRFEIVEPANRFELDQMIGAAVSRQEPLLFYYWQPNAVLSQFSFRQVGLGPYDPDAIPCLARRDCADPSPSAFPPEQVVVAVAQDLFIELPRIASYFQRASMPLDVMNALLAWQNEQGATVEATADYFVEWFDEVWRPWVAD